MVNKMNDRARRERVDNAGQREYLNKERDYIDQLNAKILDATNKYNNICDSVDQSKNVLENITRLNGMTDKDIRASNRKRYFGTRGLVYCLEDFTDKCTFPELKKCAVSIKNYVENVIEAKYLQYKNPSITMKIFYKNPKEKAYKVFCDVEKKLEKSSDFFADEISKKIFDRTLTEDEYNFLITASPKKILDKAGEDYEAMMLERSKKKGLEVESTVSDLRSRLYSPDKLELNKDGSIETPCLRSHSSHRSSWLC